MTLQERILLYFELSPEEQAEVDELILHEPHLAALMEESRVLHEILEMAEVENAAMLVDYVLYKAIGEGKAPDRFVERYAEIEASVDEYPAMRARVDAIRASIDRLTGEAEDPISRFERLVLDMEPPSTRRDTRPPTRPLRILRRYRWAKLALAACFGLVIGYGMLALVSWYAESDRARVANLHGAVSDYQEMTFRSAQGSDRLSEAVHMLREARTSTLGLFPVYDEDKLETAAGLCVAVLAGEEDGITRRAEAAGLLGRIRALQGQDEEAIEALEFVLQSREAGAPEARRLLNFLRHGDS